MSRSFEVTVEMTNIGNIGNRPTTDTYPYPADDDRLDLSCPNPICLHGGFRISGVAREMVEAGQAEKVVRGACRGREKESSGRRPSFAPCRTYYECTVRMKTS